MKGINPSGQAPNTGGVASFSAPRDRVSPLAFPTLAREKNHYDVSFSLVPLENQCCERTFPGAHPFIFLNTLQKYA